MRPVSRGRIRSLPDMFSSPGMPEATGHHRRAGQVGPTRTLLVRPRGQGIGTVAWNMVRLLPDADLAVFARCGRWTQIERADDFNDLVRNFLARSLRAADPLGDDDDHGQQPSRRSDGAHPVSAGGRRRRHHRFRAPRHDDLARDLPGRSGADLQPLLALCRPQSGWPPQGYVRRPVGAGRSSWCGAPSGNVHVFHNTCTHRGAVCKLKSATPRSSVLHRLDLRL